MAIFRNIQMSFWTDPKIADDFLPEDKLFYLYLLTNPHTNLCGCYEVSMKQMSDETGYTRERVEKIIKRLEEIHKVIIYSKETREVLLINWHKYNWTTSEKLRVPLGREIQSVKNTEFKAFLLDLFNGIDTVSIPYPYPMDTTVAVTDTITDTDTVSDSNNYSKKITVYYPEDEMLDKAFSDFAAMRKQIKKPLTVRAVTLAQNKLTKLSGGDNDKAVEILNQSVMNCWQDLYPLKENKDQQKKQSIFDQIMNA